MNPSLTEFVLQWNTRSLISHWGQFKHYILNNNPLAAAIQETRFIDSDFINYTFKIPGYSLYTHNTNTGQRQGGSALLISNNLLHHQINLNSNLDAVGVNVKLAQLDLTLISIYLRPSDDLDIPSLTQLIQNINTPCLIMGDFNSHHQAWGCDTNTRRGQILLDLLDRQNLIFLNNLTPTHIHHHNGKVTYSAIDLAITSPRTAPLFTFQAQSDPLFSDHFPIHIELQVPSGQTNFFSLPRWNFRKADWSAFKDHIDTSLPPNSHPDINTFLNSILTSAHQHIPRTQHHPGRRASPWWNTECQKAVAIRKRALKQFQRCICDFHEKEARRTRSQANYMIKQAKQQSWQEFSSQFNRFTPLSKIWSLLKSFTNKRPPLYKIPHLNINNISFSLPIEVATEFAKYFANISSTQNCTPPLMNLLTDQSQTLNFESLNNESYNAPFSSSELSHALNKCGKTSVGPDQIDYAFFKNLSDIGFKNLLSAFNSLWVDGTFPDAWHDSTLIPILKPRKPPSSPSSYRPISLTSCACKLIERIINGRLRTYLEYNNIISPFQSGFRPGRSTADNLVRLIDSVQRGFQQREITLALFLDLKAAFDRVNKKALLIKIHKCGIRGRLATFIQNFLNNRTFKVRCGNTYSPSSEQDHGVPQGSVISPTLFTIMINDIFNDIELINQQLKFSMYADDLVVWYTHSSVDQANQIIQLVLNKIQLWCDQWGLEISPKKSAVLIFSKRIRHVKPYIPLKLNDQIIPIVKTFKYLGITLDPGLNFTSHFKDIVQRCTRRLNIIKSLAGRDWGADRSTLLNLYTSLIRPILDYNGFLFDEISSQKIETLQTVQNAALRIITGASRTSNTHNLHIDTNIPLLCRRRKYQLLRFYANATSYPTRPTFQVLTQRIPSRLTNLQKRFPRINLRIEHTLDLFNIPQINTLQTPPLTPHWLDSPPESHYLFPHNKNTVSAAETHALFNKFKSEHDEFSFIFTDGSMNDGRTGMAYFHKNSENKLRLPDINSVYTSELSAILLALGYIKNAKIKKAIICTDSSSSVMAISTITELRHPIIYKIRNSIENLRINHTTIKLLWIPGHSGIFGNEQADKLAKLSLQSTQTNNLPSPLNDIYKYIQQQFISLQQRDWDDIRHFHLYPIKPKISHFISSKQDCREKEIILARLRIGHTKLTHYHIFDNLPPPTCQHCPNQPRYTIQHFLIDCPHLHQHRHIISQYIQRHKLILNLSTLLGDDHPELIDLLFEFLRKTQLVNNI